MVPPKKSRSSQLLPSEVTKTNKIANTRILVAQIIRRLEILIFVASEVALNTLSYIDETLQICPEICRRRFGLE